MCSFVVTSYFPQLALFRMMSNVTQNEGVNEAKKALKHLASVMITEGKVLPGLNLPHGGY